MKLTKNIAFSVIGPRGLGRTTTLIFLGEVLYDCGITNIKTLENLPSNMQELLEETPLRCSPVGTSSILISNGEPTAYFVDNINDKETFQRLDSLNSVIVRLSNLSKKTTTDDPWLYSVSCKAFITTPADSLKLLKYHTRLCFEEMIQEHPKFKNSIMI